MTATRHWSEPICLDPTCYRGRCGDWNYQYKDGPCAAKDCAWPWQFYFNGEWITVTEETKAQAGGSHAFRRLPARPHFTDTPSPPVVDAGKAALAERQFRIEDYKPNEPIPEVDNATFATGEWQSEMGDIVYDD